MEAAAIPLPSPLTTPPVMKMYFVLIACLPRENVQCSMLNVQCRMHTAAIQHSTLNIQHLYLFGGDGLCVMADSACV